MKDTVGIETKLEWPRILHLFRLGLIASIMVLISDMLLGYGAADESLSGLERTLSAYVGLTDSRLFWSALLGLIGIPIEGLCYFGIYRLMAETAPKHAHAYRAGVLGYLIFGACGVHVPCLMACYFYKTLYAVDPTLALEKSVRFGLYFMAPAFALFFVFFCVLTAVQIHAFAAGKTPYPRWCWIFSLAFIVVVAVLTEPFPASPLANALSAAWISLANIWMFGGLLIVGKKIER